jgi:hypothetical protein
MRSGDKVRLRSTGEVGVIVWGWNDEVMGRDFYVAFFGNQFPDGKPTEKPYVLRYAECSLELVSEDSNLTPSSYVRCKVRLIGTDRVGVVVCGWDDGNERDYYIAFFGSAFPDGKPDQKPYILRYPESSLELLNED